MASETERRIAELEARLAKLEAIEAIRELRFKYHEFINEGKFGSIAALFTTHAELDFGRLGKARGREEIGRFFSALGAPASSSAGGSGTARGLTRIRQFIHNHSVIVEGDRARGYAYLEAKPVYNGESYVVAARYDDEYEREGGQWKFSRMLLKPFFMVPLKDGWAGKDLFRMGH